MIQRPKRGEGEEDLLRMQEEFLQEKSKDQNFQAAAQVTNLRRIEPTKRSNTNESQSRKPSKYAQSKGLKNHGEKRAKNDNSLVGDILEKNTDKPEHDDDKVYYPKLIPTVLGDIVEKNVDSTSVFQLGPMPLKGFPAVSKRTEKFPTRKVRPMDIDPPSTSTNDLNAPKIMPPKSSTITLDDANQIHTENMEKIRNMSEKDILEEKQKLLTSLDPKLIEFLKSKRQKSNTKNTPDTKAPSDPKRNPVACQIDNLEDMETESVPVYDIDTLWDNDVLSHPEASKWLHFDSLEKDKLEWMKGIEESKKVKENEPYEARFDFQGYLLPYAMHYTEETKTLYHHGEEPDRPGYSLTELLELSRSAVTQQRAIALNSIAGIFEYYFAGTYKDIIDIPLSKLFFVIRIALDENKVIILEPALKAMRNLLYNRIDEASIDALMGFEDGIFQPSLANDKSEIEELDSKESELNDFHIAEIDLITVLLRTDILQRLYYILETVRPSFNCVQYCLQILTRLARDSVETASAIVQKEPLMNTIIVNFLPAAGINFAFTPEIVYKGKPILAALKLLRVLSMQHTEINFSLVKKYDILKPLSIYISSALDRTYGLRVQIEAYCILSNILYHGMGYECVKNLFPVIIVSLYKHVQGTDVFADSSVLSATHGAVILQLINKLLSWNVLKEDYKSQIYPLVKEGILKWLGQLSNTSHYTCGHLRLVCSALDCCKSILLLENVPLKFIFASLKQLTRSVVYSQMISNIVTSSNLLSGLDNNNLHLTRNIMSLGGVVVDSTQKVLPILNTKSPLPFFNSLFNFLLLINDHEISVLYLKSLSVYLSNLASTTPCLCDNWFTRMEINLIVNILKLCTNNLSDSSESNKDLLYMVAGKLCYILRIDRKHELEYLFQNIIFNKQWFTAERLMNLVNLSDADGFSKVLSSIEDIKQCYSKAVNINYKDTGPYMVLRKWMEPLLPRDWIYLPILTLYSNSQTANLIHSTKLEAWHAEKVAKYIAMEKEFIIKCSLEWILFNELCFPDLLTDIEITDRFCRLLCIFLCDNSLFLEPKIKLLLQRCIQTLFKKKSVINFDKQLTGLHNFQDFYTQLLEQFQSVSYGDYTFAACVLVPLAQRHNVKWRKLLWSEYAGCLRALDCPEEFLCYDIKEYLYPEETDESLLKSYFQALSGNLLRPNTVAHKIATHHVECYKNRTSTLV